MSWMGKILGGGIGLVFGGPVGAIMGAVAGHHVLDNRAGGKRGLFSALENKQTIYFVTTFSMLAKLAKADGIVTQQEIDIIDRVMRDHLRLNASARKFAIEIFNTAKDSEARFEDFAQQFFEEFGRSTAVLVSLVDLLLLIAHADGQLHETEEKLILIAVKTFGLQDQYRQIKSRFSGVPDDIEKYYAILGATKDEAMTSIKKKYRKLAMEYHPDRIQANGLPPEFAAAAEEKFKEIQHAYDLVSKERQ